MAEMTESKRNLLLIVMPYLLKTADFKDSKLRSFKAFPYGLLSIASYLKAKTGGKATIELLDCNLYHEKTFLPVIKKKLNEFKPDIVGLSMMFDNSYRYLDDVASAIKQYDNNIVVVLGGSAATSSYAAILNDQKNIDAICFYEGEIPLLRMIGNRNIMSFLENDASWITRKSLHERRTPRKTPVRELDDAIDIDYSFTDASKYEMMEAFSPFAHKVALRKQFFLVTSRGCPYRCAFCIHSGDADKSMRYASAGKVVAHVESLVRNYGMNVLTIYDDQILLNQERAKQIFRELARFKLRVECPNGLSVAFMDEELIALMREAGMDTVNLAIESGSPYVLNKIIHKPLRLDMVKPVVHLLRNYGFWVHGFFVSGIPGETDEHRNETIRFIKEVNLDWSGFSLLMPTRGSDLFKMCVKRGFINRKTGIGELEYNKYIINTPEYSADYVIKKTYLMNLEVNFVNNFRMKNGECQIAADAFLDVIKRYGDHAFAYYYLSKALGAMNRRKEAEAAMHTYHEIRENDDAWKEYANYFKLN